MLECTPMGHNFHTKFREYPLNISKVEMDVPSQHAEQRRVKFISVTDTRTLMI